MAINNVLEGLRFAARRAIDRFVVQPAREKEWASKTIPFEYRSPEGHSFILYPTEHVDQYIYRHGIYEKRFLDLLRYKFSKDSIALDIGANIGNHSVYLAESFAAIHAFEPNPTALARLRRNLALNNLDERVIVHPVALGREGGVLPFRENEDGNLGASGFLQADEIVAARSRSIDLPVVNADDYVATLDLSRIDFIKVDVEGWEAQLFEGMSATLSTYRPIVAFEFHGQAVASTDYDRIIATLPGYVMAEACYAPSDAPLLAKVKWNIAHAGRPLLRRIKRPEARTYENILGFPDEETFARFILES